MALSSVTLSLRRWTMSINNMVYADVPMNQVTSVTCRLTETLQIWMVLLGSQGALGTYFSDTATIFLNTRCRSKTCSQNNSNPGPDPTLSIPGIFNEWLENLIDTYPTDASLEPGNMEYVQVVNDGYIPADEHTSSELLSAFNPTSFTASVIFPSVIAHVVLIVIEQGFSSWLDKWPNLRLLVIKCHGLWKHGHTERLSLKAFDLSATGAAVARVLSDADTTDRRDSVYIDCHAGK
ncbi:hypothetical protein B0H13DRAFT_1876895 [Mycena leptocephala]|nr:hypothetical protein B0H13DRAFT_1876895 [Mycena leptocephala]